MMRVSVVCVVCVDKHVCVVCDVCVMCVDRRVCVMWIGVCVRVM